MCPYRIRTSYNGTRRARQVKPLTSVTEGTSCAAETHATPRHRARNPTRPRGYRDRRRDDFVPFFFPFVLSSFISFLRRRPISIRQPPFGLHVSSSSLLSILYGGIRKHVNKYRKLTRRRFRIVDNRNRGFFFAIFN